MKKTLLPFLIFLISSAQVKAQFCFTQSYSGNPPSNSAFSICSADFNNDGKVDVVATNTMNAVGYFQGLGTGSFMAPVTTNFGGTVNYPNGSITADFNQDGNADFASAEVSSGHLTVLLGDGTGSFSSMIHYPVSGAKSLRAGDFNGDGKLDLAVVSPNTNSVYIFINDGSGNFSQNGTYTVPGGNPQPYDVCVLDFNADGNKDLVTANFSSGNTTLFLGTGNGTFSAGNNLAGAALSSPYSICNYDFNQDGNEDFVVTNSTNPNAAYIHLSNGNSAVLSTIPIPSSGNNQARNVTVGDFNGDNAIDILIAYNGSNNVGVYAGPSYGTPFTISTGGGPRWLTTSDYNNDGKLDFGVACNSSGNIQIFINTLPIISISGNSPICKGNSLTLTGSGATNYTWSTTATTSTISVTPSVTTSYTLSGDISGCATTGTQVVTVTVNPTPTITINASSTTLCSGQQETLTASGANTYTWSGGVTNGVAFTPTASANYTVNATDLNGCAGTNSTSITVNPVPSLTVVSTATAVCNGTPVTITASGATSYTWSGGITNGVAFTPTATTTYTLTATNSFGCSSTAVKTIIVNTTPTLSVTATPTFVCHGTSCTLTATGTATSYSWSGGVSNGVAFYPASSTNYTVTATNSNGCVSTATQSISVSVSSLAFSVNPQNGVAPLPVTITNSTPGLSNYNFTWFFGDGSSAVNNNASVFYTYNFAGLYDVGVIATNTLTGCHDTLVKPAFVNVSGSGCSHTVAITPAGPLNKCVGDTVTLTALTNAPSSYTTQWNFNGVTITGATASTLSVTQSGYYSVTITKSSCPVTSAATQISFATAPATPTITSQGSIIPCVTSVDTLICSPMSGVTYSWSTSQTTSSITVTNPGVYYVTVTNGANCSATSAAYSVTAVMATPQICMVTTDTTSTNNIVYWDKTSYLNADSFIVFREVSSNIYKRVGAVSKDSLSEFVDVNRSIGPANGDPNIGYYHYKLQIRDTCGNYSSLSPYHTTVKIIDNHDGSFTWNLYVVEGMPNPVPNFYLYRDSANIGDWRVVGSVAGTTNLIIDPSYSSYASVGNWRVEADGFVCTPTLRQNHNSAQGTIVRTKSNITNNRTTSVNMVTTTALKLFPNPATNLLNITADTKLGAMKLYNSLGALIMFETTNNIEHTFDIGKLTPGIYILDVLGRHYKFVKE